MKIKKVVIVSPSYNVAKRIQPVLEGFLDLQAILGRRAIELSVMIFDDCSQDQTIWILSDFCAKYSFLRFQTNSQNLGNTDNRLIGYQWILDNLINETASTLVAFMDSDGEHTPLSIPVCLANFENNKCDVVIGAIAYPEHRLNNSDYQTFKSTGIEQSTMLALDQDNLIYLPAPGFQIHRLACLQQTLPILWQFQQFYQQENQETLPRWGMPFVVLYLSKITGAKLETIYLPPLLKERPNRTDEKRLLQMDSYHKLHQSLRNFSVSIPPTHVASQQNVPLNYSAKCSFFRWKGSLLIVNSFNCCLVLLAIDK